MKRRLPLRRSPPGAPGSGAAQAGATAGALAAGVLPRALSVALLGVLPAIVPGAEPASSAPVTPVTLAESSLVSISAREDAAGVELALRRRSDGAALTAESLRVNVDGQSVPVSARGPGLYQVTLAGARTGAPLRIDIELAHDGLHELLSGTLRRAGAPSVATASEAHPAAAATGSHKQIYWWILNIAVVAVAAVALSRAKR